MPRPLRLALRLLVVGILIESVLYICEDSIARGLLHVFPAEIEWLAGDFTVLSAQIVSRGASLQVQIFANLAHPVQLEGRTMVPFGTLGSAPGQAFELSVPLGDTFEYCVLTIILVLAWPAARRTELAWRCALSIPLLALLQLCFPCVVIAQLCQGVRQVLNMTDISAWTILGDFLVGGGGLVLAMLIAAVVLTGAKHLSHTVGPLCIRNWPNRTAA